MHSTFRIITVILISLAAFQCSANTALIDALIDGRVPEARNLAQSSEDFARMGECFNALMVASGIGDTQTVRTLMKRGMDPNTRSPVCYPRGATSASSGEGGKTALMFAANSDIARLLLEAGADPDERTTRGHTALYEALWSNNYEVAMVLISGGADVNVFDTCGDNVYLKRMAWQKKKNEYGPKAQRIQQMLVSRGAKDLTYNPSVGNLEGLPDDEVIHTRTGIKYPLEKFGHTEDFFLKYPPDYYITDVPERLNRFHPSEFKWASTGNSLLYWEAQRKMKKIRDKGDTSGCARP